MFVNHNCRCYGQIVVSVFTQCAIGNEGRIILAGRCNAESVCTVRQHAISNFCVGQVLFKECAVIGSDAVLQREGLRVAIVLEIFFVVVPDRFNVLEA